MENPLKPVAKAITLFAAIMFPLVFAVEYNVIDIPYAFAILIALVSGASIGLAIFAWFLVAIS